MTVHICDKCEQSPVAREPSTVVEPTLTHPHNPKRLFPTNIAIDLGSISILA